MPLRGADTLFFLLSARVSVADSGAASQGGCGLWDRPRARDVLSLSHFSLKAQLCKWLTAYIQNVHCYTKHTRSPRRWVCAGHAMITRQRVNATPTFPLSLKMATKKIIDK